MAESVVSEYLTNLFGLSGKTAVVIGGSGVLGGAIADSLGAAGAHVVIVGRNSSACDGAVLRIQNAGGSAEAVIADATQREDLERIVAHLKDDDRVCDILVNSAGTNSPTPFLEITDEEWDHILNVNLRGVRLACQVFGQFMLDAGTEGAIINVASLSAIIPLSRVFTYSASKAAVLNLSQNLAREWAPQGIRVNTISPGFFPAEQNRKVLTSDRIESIFRHTPMERFGEPQELAGAILLMASNQAGSFSVRGEHRCRWRLLCDDDLVPRALWCSGVCTTRPDDEALIRRCGRYSYLHAAVAEDDAAHCFCRRLVAICLVAVRSIVPIVHAVNACPELSVWAYCIN